MLANPSSVTSDNGASQEGGPLGYVNAAGPRNSGPSPSRRNSRNIRRRRPTIPQLLPLGWAYGGQHALRRYKQNTHGGGFAIAHHLLAEASPPVASASPVSHVCDLTPTLLDLLGVEAPAEINGVRQMPIEGRAVAQPQRREVPSKARPQYSRCSATAEYGTQAGRRRLSSPRHTV